MYEYRPTHVEIDLGALRSNYLVIRRQLPQRCQVLAVVKADAYGHGAVPVARELQQLGAELLGVAIAEEGLELRNAGIHRPIVVLGGAWPGQEEVLIRHQLQPCVFEVEQLLRLQAAASRLRCRCYCHLKVDSGMGRLGVLPSALGPLLDVARGCSNLVIEGVMSHFSVADDPSHPYTRQQLAVFEECVQQVGAAGFSPRYLHLANSAAIFDGLGEYGNLVRPGIALYGGQPFPGQELPLQPVMSFRTGISHLRQLPAGSAVSYGRRFITQRPSVIAAIPVGYADGYNRLLSAAGTALVRGQRVRIAGTICMDWTLLDVTDVADVASGDQVTLLGCDGEECVSAQQWAQQTGTISYEVFCQISKRVPRRYRGGLVGG